MSLFGSIPNELIEPILTFTKDPELTIKIECILHGIPSGNLPHRTAFDRIWDPSIRFPISHALTSGSPYRSPPHYGINPETASLCVISWLIRFRPEVFSRQCGKFTKDLIKAGRMRSLEMMSRDPNVREEAFGWGSLCHATEAGHFDVIKFLVSNELEPITRLSMEKSVMRGDLEAFKYQWQNRPKIPNDVKPSVKEYWERHRIEGDDVVERALKPERERLEKRRVEHLVLINKAVEVGNIDIAKFILDEHPSIPIKPKAVSRACENGHIEMIRYLIDHVFSDLNWTFVGPLSLKKTIERRDKEMLLLLDAASKQFTLNVLADAAATGEIDLIDFVDSELGPMNQEQMNRAVHRAASDGNLIMLKYLRECLDCKSCSFEAMIECGGNGHIECLDYLEERLYLIHPDDPKVLISRKVPFSPLLRLRHMGLYGRFEKGVLEKAAPTGHVHVFKYLQRCGRIQELRAAFKLACHFGQLELAEYLHSLGSTTRRGFQYATPGGQIDMIDFLVNQGSREYDRKAVVLAASHGRQDLCDLFLSQCPNPLTIENVALAVIEGSLKGGHHELYLRFREFYMEPDLGSISLGFALYGTIDTIKFVHELYPNAMISQNGYDFYGFLLQGSATSGEILEYVLDHKLLGEGTRPVTSNSRLNECLIDEIKNLRQTVPFGFGGFYDFAPSKKALFFIGQREDQGEDWDNLDSDSPKRKW
ncbi:hypothetical protein HDU97_007095 [Phlyctochytrium planicorne]|nr:hypothetical protein HDU97_007095 [Phlyctochytrium planicorne]